MHRSRLALIVFGLILVLGSAGWGWFRSRSQPAVRRLPRLDVLLITIDTLRADAVGAYRGGRAATPSIDRLAAGGVRFVDAHAHNVTTLPSHANILSGRYPNDHGVRDNSGFRFPTTTDTLATLLKAHGYRTGAFISAFPLDSRFGLDRGFDVYDDSFVEAQARPAFLEQERRGVEAVALARRWIGEGGSGQPYFCWVHLYEPHFPYAPPEPFASRFQSDPYLGEVAAVDDAVAPLVEAAAAGGRTLIVLTADHGESLGEHGEATHGIFAYEATLRVPLIMFQPQLFPPHVTDAPARHVDVLPTILDALAIPAPGGIAGRSVLSELAGVSARQAQETASAQPMYFEALSGTLNRGWAPLRGVIDRRFKYIDLPIPELYDLERDPKEEHNLADSDRRHVGELRALVASIQSRASPAQPRAETADARRRLRSLGYVAAAAAVPPRYTEADDPKRLLALDELLQDVNRRYFAGDLRGALARCRELVERRPKMAVSLLELAHLERESGNLPAGIDALRRAARLNPEDTATVSLLGAYLTQAGRASEAVDLLAPYARRDPADLQVLVTLALALAAAGQPTAALSGLAEAVRRDPTNAMLRVETGTVYLMTGDRARARQEFEAALTLNGRVARAYSSLGVMAAEDGRRADAIAYWKQALNADPSEAGKLVAFAGFMRRNGHEADAQSFFELAQSHQASRPLR